MVNKGIYTYGLTSRISLDYMGGEPNDWSFATVVTRNGRQVVYVSEASDLVNGDTNAVWDVFAYDSQRISPTFLTIPGNITGVPGTGCSGAGAVHVYWTNHRYDNVLDRF